MNPKIFKILYFPSSNLEDNNANAEKFVIQDKDDKYLIYIPMKGICVHVNKDFVDLLESNNEVVKKFLKFSKSVPFLSIPKNNDQLTTIDLSLTSNCNMRCKYCYVSGGDAPEYMQWSTAKTAINYAIKHSGNKLVLNFQGEGEPTLAFNLMKNCYSYAKQKCDAQGKNFKVSLTTNGVINQDVINWLEKIKSNLILSVSFDGLPDLQNAQRPLKDGSPSYEVVTKNMRYLKEKGVNFTVLVTVTRQGIKHMPAIVQHLHELKIDSVSFGSVLETGRCKKNKITGSLNSTSDFLKQIVSSHEVAKKFNIDISVLSGPTDLKEGCYATNPGFVVTTKGYISACPAVTNPDNPASKIFMYGKIEKESIEIDNQKIQYLQSRTISNTDVCKDCFAKWQCGGGCPVQYFRKHGSIFVPVKDNGCKLTKNFLKYLLTNSY